MTLKVISFSTPTTRIWCKEVRYTVSLEECLRYAVSSWKTHPTPQKTSRARAFPGNCKTQQNQEDKNHTTERYGKSTTVSNNIEDHNSLLKED